MINMNSKNCSQHRVETFLEVKKDIQGRIITYYFKIFKTKQNVWNLHNILTKMRTIQFTPKFPRLELGKVVFVLLILRII